MLLAERGHTLEWLWHLDMCQVQALTESSERLYAQQRLTDICDGRQVAHADKKIKAYMAPLKKAAQVQMDAGDADAVLKAAQE